jgi:hypothetical protein
VRLTVSMGLRLRWLCWYDSQFPLHHQLEIAALNCVGFGLQVLGYQLHSRGRNSIAICIEESTPVGE